MHLDIGFVIFFAECVIVKMEDARVDCILIFGN